MWAGLPALAWCALAGVWRRDPARAAAALGYAVSLGLWMIAPKPVQFYYHYFGPSFFLLAALALACSDLRRLPRAKWLAWAIPAGSAAMFAWFFPIIAALPLPRADSYLGWVWLSAWG
jgi:dolichyl-phosphate-mannose--protein O-mannosyl transferase